MLVDRASVLRPIWAPVSASGGRYANESSVSRARVPGVIAVLTVDRGYRRPSFNGTNHCTRGHRPLPERGVALSDDEGRRPMTQVLAAISRLPVCRVRAMP